MNDTPDISLVIPFYNRRSDVRPCLETAMNQKVPGKRIEIIAVDNGSTDGTRELLATFPVRLVDCKTRGPAAARNAGIQAARAPIVAMMDSDCLASRHWLRLLTAPFDDPEVLGCGGKIGARSYKTGVEVFTQLFGVLNQEKFFRGYPPLLPFPPYFATASAAYRREALMKVGGFDESLWMCEDADLAWRILDLGGKLVYCPHEGIRHRHRGTFDGMFKQAVDYGAGAVALFAKHRKRFRRRIAIDWIAIFLLAIAPFQFLMNQFTGKDEVGRKWMIYYTIWASGFWLGKIKASWKYRVLCI